MIVFDIETGPLDKETVISRSKEFHPPKHPGFFDVEQVKLGNLKDPAKIRERIELSEQKHEQALKNYEAECKKAFEDWESELMSKASLSAQTGEILAIGYKAENGIQIDICDEENLLAQFWEEFEKAYESGEFLVGHNIFGFDLPFICRRSWMLGVYVPIAAVKNERFWNPQIFIDTQKKWCFGSNVDFISLENLSLLLGGEPKTEGVDGSMFAGLIKGTQEDQETAINYLEDDLELTWHVAERLGVFPG